MAASLIELLGDLKDPRDPRGVQYPLVSVLALCLVAILAGHTGFAAIAQFGRLRQQRLGHALGFKNGKMPCANMISQLLRELDADHLDRIIGTWLTSRHAGGWQHIALDGKTMRGSRDGDVPGTHLLAAYAPQASTVIAQMRVEATTNEHKTALRLLGVLPPLQGAVVTADAMFTHRDVCKNVLKKEGDYVLYAKDNQMTLQQNIRDSEEVAGRWHPELGERVDAAGLSGTQFRSEGNPVLNLTPKTSPPVEVERGRMDLLADLNADHRGTSRGESELGARIANIELAGRMQVSASNTLDHSKEPVKVQAHYGLDNPSTRDSGVS